MFFPLFSSKKAWPIKKLCTCSTVDTSRSIWTVACVSAAISCTVPAMLTWFSSALEPTHKALLREYPPKPPLGDLLVSQLMPVVPYGQWHVYELLSPVQFPPCWQGSAPHWSLPIQFLLGEYPPQPPPGWPTCFTVDTSRSIQAVACVWAAISCTVPAMLTWFSSALEPTHTAELY